MEFGFYFKTAVRCKVYNKDNVQDGQLVSYTKDIELHISEETAANILFKFTPSAFMLDGYKALYKYDVDNNIKGLSLFDKEDRVYIIVNLGQFLSEVNKGYIRYQMMKLINNVDEFDFEAAIDLNNKDIEDEFES